MTTTKEIDMELYAGIDLHSNNSVVSVLDENDRVVFAKRLPNDLAAIIAALRSCSGKLHGVAVESTYNWYWLVDGLQDAGFALHLVNTAAAQAIRRFEVQRRLQRCAPLGPPAAPGHLAHRLHLSA
jgi:transposase